MIFCKFAKSKELKVELQGPIENTSVRRQVQKFGGQNLLKESGNKLSTSAMFIMPTEKCLQGAKKISNFWQGQF